MSENKEEVSSVAHRSVGKGYGILLGLVLFGVALAIRLLWFNDAVSDGHLWIFSDDPPYHLRRILLTLESWPRVPTSDPFVNFPHSVTLYWPPGLPWLVAGFAKMLGATDSSHRYMVEWITALTPPFVGSLTILIFYGTSRKVLGQKLAFLIALLLSLVPAHVQYTKFSRFDHHIFEPLLSWLLLWFVIRSANETERIPRILWTLAGASTITFALLVWPGVLLQLGLLVVALLLAFFIVEGWYPHGRLASLIAKAGAWIFGTSVLTSLPVLFLSPWAMKPVFFATSPLHLASLTCATATFAWLGYGPPRFQQFALIGRLLLATVAPACFIFALPALHQPVLKGLQYTMGSPFAMLAMEARSFFGAPQHFLTIASWPAVVSTLAVLAWIGWKLFGAPPQLLTGRSPSQRLYLMVMLSASITLVGPALISLRWLMAWSPFGFFAVAVFWQWILQPLGARWLPGKELRWKRLLLFALFALYLPSLLHSIKLHPIGRSQIAAQKFYLRMRTLTPSIKPEFSETKRPPYGVLTSWSIGHIVTYMSGRPTLANNFFGMPWHDRANRLALRLLLDDDCEHVAKVMRQHHLKYVVTTPETTQGFAKLAKAADLNPRSFVSPKQKAWSGIFRSLLFRLGARDGQRTILPGPQGKALVLKACGQFRLVAEAHVFPSPRQSPGQLKLFELVRGASLKVIAAPGTLVSASILLRTQRGRTTSWNTQTTVSSAGSALLRVPYASERECGERSQPCPVRIVQRSYTVRIGKHQIIQVPVSTQAVRRGNELIIRAKPLQRKLVPK